MSFFSSTINAYLAGTRLRCDPLVFFDFTTIPMRVWQGFGRLKTNDGNMWDGIGGLGSIPDLQSDFGGTAPETTFTLSGVDPDNISRTLNQSDEVKGRPVFVYLQFFGENIECLDNPYAWWAGVMDRMSIEQEAQGGKCTVSVNAEGRFALRSLPPNGLLSDREERRLFGEGADGLWEIPFMEDRTVVWPLINPPSS